ncbi:hypothetical protein ACFLUP_02020 [Chloroflexota bacterium]
MPYLAILEKAGIPTLLIDLEDQHNMVQQESLVQGVPNIRYLPASRTLPGPEDVDSIIEDVLAGLTSPLTEKEKERGRYEPPTDRILFEGTLDEAQKFYQQAKWIPLPVEAPICVYTDGFPIVEPTEERVKEMLTGTSHNPDELVAYQHDIASPMMAMRGMMRKKGDVVRFEPLKRTATVEQVAVNAVMAGCKPEHLPVVLALSQSGCPISTTNFPSQHVCLSGPIVKEIQLNIGCGHLGPGSPVNGPIGRAYQMMAVNLSGAVPGVNRMGCHGNPLNNGGVCYGENVDGLPAGWKGLNEEFGFKNDESVVMVQQGGGGIQGSQFSPGGYRALQKSGHGGIARRFDVKGTSGPHNWLDYIVPGLWAIREGGATIVMVAEMAQHLVDLGFKSKDEVCEYIWKKSFEPLKDYRVRSWPDFGRNGWMGIEKTSGKPWKELDDDYMVPVAGDDPNNNCIIVAGGQEEASVQFAGGRGTAYSIDAWR